MSVMDRWIERRLEQRVRRPRGLFGLGIALLLLAGAVQTAIAQQSPPVRPAAVSPNSEPAPAEHPLRPAIRVAQLSLEALDGVKDYDCELTKRELIGQQLLTQVMYMRLREEPFSLYCKFGPPHAGREVLFVAGRNNNQILAHEGSGVKSLVGTVSLPVDGPDARAENRHPLTQAGLRNMVRLLIEQWERESEYGEIDVQFYPNARLGQTQVCVIESRHPVPRRQFLYHITRFYMDATTRLPVRVENYSWPQHPGGQPLLVEEYTYRNVRLNVGLDDRHFDRSWREYNF